MRHYHHLILSEREKLLFFLAKGCTLTYIAKKLGRNKSMISMLPLLNAYTNNHNQFVEYQGKI